MQNLTNNPKLMAKKKEQTKQVENVAGAQIAQETKKKAAGKKAPAATKAETPAAPEVKAEAEKPFEFPPLPDPAKAGPPFDFDNNNLCLNPVLNSLRLPAGIVVHLAVCMREKTWFGSKRVDFPATDKKPAHFVGTAQPFGGFESSFGYHTQQQATYEVARDALVSLQEEMAATKHKDAKEILFEADKAVKAIEPPSNKLAASDIGLIGYRAQDAAQYMGVYARYAAAHHTGAIFPADLSRDDARDFALGMVHQARTSKWVLADWYNHCRKHHPDLLDVMISESNRQTIANEAQVAERFAPDERFPNLSFTHHQEAAFVKNKRKRMELMELAQEKNMKVKALREEVRALNAPPAPAGLPAPSPASTTTTATTTTTDKTQTQTAAPGGPATAPETPRAGDGLLEVPSAQPGAKGEFEEDPVPGAVQFPQTPADLAMVDHERLAEILDEAQTLVRRGAMDGQHIPAGMIRNVRTILAELAQAVGLVVTSPAK